MFFVQCSFIPKFNITISTRYEDDNGSQENVSSTDLTQLISSLSKKLIFCALFQCLNLPPNKLAERTVDHIDIAFDDLANAKHYKREEDPKFFKSVKTKRGPLIEGWRDDKPIMCSYKLVNASFEVWGFQTRVEDYIQRCIRDVLLLGHRQAFTWIDDWIDMSLADVRDYERELQAETNRKLGVNSANATSEQTPALETDTSEADQIPTGVASAVEPTSSENALEQTA